MGQGYGENFVNLMLGWIRQLVSSVAGLFAASGGGQSGGRALLDWFSAHWLALLLVLIVVGVVVDWVVWMLRWRPYWLWFRKRRVILDDDIDEELSEDELLRRYGLREEAPRFHSRALPRDDDEGGYEDDYGYEDGYEDGYETGDGDGEGYEAYVEDDEEAADEDGAAYFGEDVAEEDERDIIDGEGYGDREDEYPRAVQEQYGRDEAYGAEAELDSLGREEGRRRIKPLPIEDDGKWDDLPRKKSRRPLFGRERREEEEDPFAVDEKAFHDLDDDFFQVVSEEPHPEADEDLRIYARPQPRQQAGLEPPDTEDGNVTIDQRMGYPGGAPLSGADSSRKSRRRRRREQEE